MALQIAKALGLKKVQETCLLAMILGARSPLGQARGNFTVGKEWNRRFFACEIR
jgi:hypothetical protein